MRTLLLLGALAVASIPAAVSAKCYSGQDWKKDGNKFYVCIKGDETWANRHKAEAVCKKVKGSKCDAVNTYSSSCNGACYDESGKKHHSLSGY
ncbi:MAG: hypothetical protein D6806_11795 [Deltaproteobacteria bacterium]|nr:MAG: hypothetical protein D6806_11795 [Deltaproteobacteria bacterium]